MKQGRHASAQKRARQALKRKARNTSELSNMRTAIKKVRSALLAKDKQAAQGALKTAVSVIAKTAVKGVIHKRTAARYASRLTLAVNRA